MQEFIFVEKYVFSSFFWLCASYLTLVLSYKSKGDDNIYLIAILQWDIT